MNKKRDESIDILREEEFLKNDENLNSEMKMEIRNKVENIRSAWEGIFVVSSIEQKKFVRFYFNLSENRCSKLMSYFDFNILFCQMLDLILILKSYCLAVCV